MSRKRKYRETKSRLVIGQSLGWELRLTNGHERSFGDVVLKLHCVNSCTTYTFTNNH